MESIDLPARKSKFRLVKFLIDDGKSLQGLRNYLSEIEVEPFNVEKYIDFSLEQQDAQPQEVAVDVEVADFLENI